MKTLKVPDYKLVLAIDTENMTQLGWTGINTRPGGLCTIKFKYNSTNVLRQADRMRVVLASDNILEIKDSGCAVFD